MAAKGVFLRNFDEEIEAERRAQDLSLAQRFTEDEMAEAVAEARAEAFAEGRAIGKLDGIEETQATLAARQVEVLAAMIGPLREIAERTGEHHAALETQVTDFALSVCERVFPEFLATRSVAAARTEVRRALALALGKPAVKIRLSPTSHAILASEIRDLVEGEPGARHVDLAPDAKLGDGDVEVAWDDGFMSYGYAQVCARILSALRQVAGGSQPQQKIGTDSDD
ncbi:FliH/SctL family protein [Frigidibacter sp. MR17.24]|uniref:FliH/SctL family protein n=1 Tax=Frigidibacter sp. MR17.24 TaxID=3127345 RepID=UPI003012ADE3